jgi:hypothetical protein
MVTGPRLFLRPDLLDTQHDLIRMRLNVGRNAESWMAGWQKLLANRHASLAWKPNPQPIVYRGADGQHPENYSTPLFNDAAAAYAWALRWKISGDDAYAQKSVEILNTWSSALTAIEGTSDRYLASGIGIYL